MKKKNGSIGSRVNMVNDFNERNKNRGESVGF